MHERSSHQLTTGAIVEEFPLPCPALPALPCIAASGAALAKPLFIRGTPQPARASKQVSWRKIELPSSTIVLNMTGTSNRV
jgi:hypothetical protein